MDERSVSLWFLPLHQGGHLMLVSDQRITMVKLSEVDMGRALGQLEAGKTQAEVVAYFGVTQTMISKLKRKFRVTGSVKVQLLTRLKIYGIS